jgi:alkaline phosphatase D
MTSAGVAASSKWFRPAQAQTSKQYNLLAIQTGDVTANRAVIWARSDRESRLVVNFSTSPTFTRQPQIRVGSVASAETDYTGTIDLRGLRPNTTYYYQVRFVDGAVDPRSFKLQGLTGRFRTAPSPEQARSVRFVWAADMAGQGWGRNPNLTIQAFDGEKIQGGYVIFEVMRKFKPDFAIFCGDMIYADNAAPPTKAIPESVGGGTWINEPPKDFVAISLDEFRENWKYNLGDSKFARFLAETPIYVQWDDHEVTNNWYPSETVTADPYNGLSADVLAERARQAFLEYNPIRDEEIFRSYNYGKHLDLFLLDLRTYRGRNDRNTEPTLEMMGEDQLEWIKARLLNSKATWKVISNHDPISIVTGGPGDYDAWSQNDSRVLGREAEFSQLLKFIKDEEIENVVFITADVHFPAAIYYDPSRAVFKDFNPFWEFVIGPIHAGAFGPASDLPLDPSFGPEYEFSIFPKEANLPPPNNQFFGSIDVDGHSAQLTARIHDITGKVVYEKVLNPS